MNREASTVSMLCCRLCRKRSPIRPARRSSSRQTGTRSPTPIPAVPCQNVARLWILLPSMPRRRRAVDHGAKAAASKA
jgi:hypothetical protein